MQIEHNLNDPLFQKAFDGTVSRAERRRHLRVISKQFKKSLKIVEKKPKKDLQAHSRVESTNSSIQPVNPEMVKGAYLGLCNRRACLQPGAEWFNHSTRKYYCHSCAKLLNEVNADWAIPEFGHDLCTHGEHFEKEPPTPTEE